MKLAALIKKEFYRFFHDPRLVIGVIMPGVLIFLLYSILGSVIHAGETKTYDFKVYLSGSSQAVAAIGSAAEAGGNTLEWLELSDLDAAQEEVKEDRATAILTFSENFDDAHGEVGIYYDSENEGSAFFGTLASEVLTEIGMRFSMEVHDLVSVQEIGTQILSALMPMLIVCFTFATSMGLTIESVAGEKERGTLPTILVTSVNRSHVALGKIIPLACISFLGALSGFLGVALSMPKLMGFTSSIFNFGALNYLFLFLLVIGIVPLIVSVIALVSTFAKSVKEASAYTGILMIFFMVLSLVTAFVPHLGDWVVAVPVLNAVAMMQRVLAGALPVWQIFVSIGCNVAYTACAVYAMTRMFRSEKIMFGR